MEKIKIITKYIPGLIIGVMLAIILMIGISYFNIIDQSKATIDYVYAVKTGGEPEISDTWLAEEYCKNEVALNVGYPEMKSKCNYILASSHK